MPHKFKCSECVGKFPSKELLASHKRTTVHEKFNFFNSMALYSMSSSGQGSLAQKRPIFDVLCTKCGKHHQTKEDLNGCMNSSNRNDDKQYLYSCCGKNFKKHALIHHMGKYHDIHLKQTWSITSSCRRGK